MRASSAMSLGLAALLAGCGQPRSPAPPPEPGGVYDFAAEGTFPPVPPVTGDALGHEDRAASPAPATPVSPERTAGTNRIQILATRDAQAAADATRQVRERFGAVAVVEYVEPFHKVQVPCAGPDSCAALRDTLRGSGFPSAWIVRPASPR